MTLSRIGALALTFALTVPVLAHAQAPSIDGTYRLIARELPDGTRIEPPAIEGLISWVDGYRNFNIYWTDAEGDPYSIGLFATYDYDGMEYTEANIYTAVNDGGTVMYDFDATSGSAAVTVNDGIVSFDLPLRDEPLLKFDGDHLTATREGEFVDHWMRVE